MYRIIRRIKHTSEIVNTGNYARKEDAKYIKKQLITMSSGVVYRIERF